VLDPSNEKAKPPTPDGTFRFRWLPEKIDEGVGWIVVGLFFKCCLADNLAGYFNGSSSTNPYLIWQANLNLRLRIYYDFAGYSLVALGVARCLGINLTLNFRESILFEPVPPNSGTLARHAEQLVSRLRIIPMGGGRVKWVGIQRAIVLSCRAPGMVRDGTSSSGEHFTAFPDRQPVGWQTQCPTLAGLGAYDARQLLRLDELLRTAHRHAASEIESVTDAYDYNGRSPARGGTALASGTGSRWEEFLLLTALTLWRMVLG